jgi:hypothetical protein
MVAQLAVAQPNLTFTTGISVSPSQISVTTSSDGNALILADQGGTGDCWYVVFNPLGTETASPPWSAPGAVFVNGGPYYGEVKNTGTQPTCQASTAPPGPNSGTQAFLTTGQFPDL